MIEVLKIGKRVKLLARCCPDCGSTLRFMEKDIMPLGDTFVIKCPICGTYIKTRAISCGRIDYERLYN